MKHVLSGLPEPGSIALLIAAALLFSPACEQKPARVWLVENGQPRAEIVIAEDPARMTRLAASELQTYIGKISGAVLPIVTEPTAGAARIYVGVSPHTEALGLKTEGLKYGAYRMASGPDWLALLGPDKDFEPVEPYARGRGDQERAHQAWDGITGDTFWLPIGGGGVHEKLGISQYDDRGTLHAVYDFLHDLGVRWYMPGELGEVVPELRNIPLPAVDATVQPDFPVRHLNWFQGHRPTSEEDTLWRLRLRQHLGHDVVGRTQLVHGMKFVHRRDEMKQAHPEFYALRGGERITRHKDSGVPCLSAGGLFEKHVAYLRAVFDHFGEPMISIDLVDGFSGVGCGCDACAKQITPERGMGGSMSDYVWGYLNRVAAALYESHPDRLVSGLTYGTYNLPPEQIEQMAPNLALIIIPQRMSFHDERARAEFDLFLDAWRKKLASGRIFIFSNVLFNWRGRGDTGPLLPVYVHREIAEHVRSLRGISGGEIIECYEHVPDREYGYDALALAHLPIYTYSRSWWDAEQDIDGMLEEYYTLFYGPARDQMKAFIEYCEANWPRMRNEAEPIDKAFELLAAAQAEADPESAYGRRIGLIAEYLEFARPLREQLSRKPEGPEIRLPLRAADDLAIDGRLDESFWEGIPEIPLVSLRDGGAPQVPASVRMAWADNEALVIGIRCEDPEMAGIVDAADGASGIWTGDYIDLLIETPVHRYYQITVSPSGAILDLDRSRGLHTQWSSQAVVATHRGENYWSVEIQLPAAGEDAAEMDPNTGVAGIRPQAASAWHFNLCRSRPRAGTAEVSAVAPTGREHFHDRFKFGRLVVE